MKGTFDTRRLPRPGQQVRGRRWLLPLGAIVVLAVVLYVLRFNIIVTVENVGVRTIGNVEVEMSGKVYDLGDIEPGETETEFTFPNADSGVKLEWTADGERQESLIGGYVTLGSHGWIEVQVDGAEVVRSIDRGWGGE